MVFLGFIRFCLVVIGCTGFFFKEVQWFFFLVEWKGCVTPLIPSFLIVYHFVAAVCGRRRFPLGSQAPWNDFSRFSFVFFSFGFGFVCIAAPWRCLTFKAHANHNHSKLSKCGSSDISSFFSLSLSLSFLRGHTEFCHRIDCHFFFWNFFTEFYWVYWVLLDLNRFLLFLVLLVFYLFLLGLTRFDLVFPSFTGFWLGLPSFIGFDLILPRLTGFYWVSPSFTGLWSVFTRVLLGFTGFWSAFT